MSKYVCNSCWYVYDEEAGDPKAGVGPNTLFENLSEDWLCPVCLLTKEHFSPLKDVAIKVFEQANPALDRYQCNSCWYVYDPRLGDPKGGVIPGTSFSELSENWFCPVCKLSKESFTRIKISLDDLPKEEPVQKDEKKQAYQCKACYYTYDPRIGDPKAGVGPDTAFEDLDEDWFCPICMMGKNYFIPKTW